MTHTQHSTRGGGGIGRELVALALMVALVVMICPQRASAANPPAPRVDDTLSMTGTVLWDGLHTRRVSLTLANGAVIAGTIVAHDAANVAIARAVDGAVVTVPKAEVARVRLLTKPVDGLSKAPAQRTRDNGRSQYVGGALLLGFGVPIGLSGTVMLGLCVSCFYIHLPLLLPGIGMMIGGSRMMKRATAKNKAFRADWGIPLASRMRLTPNLAMGRSGAELGFTLRF